ncbi:MAG: YifB family Mg chelatase-like AAA ATPase [Candidatus Sungbacteria bacterium]|nr:YifB family Mg chelatase-like AAA ATPase [Candidatus Sungbacteria bacterium]
MVTLHSAQVVGLDATIVNVEADLSPGLHIFSIVGLADKEVQESRERIGVAIKNIGARPPHQKSQRLIINLAPADIKKEGPAFDLPIALGFLLASGQTRFDPAKRLFVGELGLDGAVKPVRGILPIVITARLAGFREVYLPEGNGEEASLIEGLAIKEVGSLQSLLDDLEGKKELAIASKKEVTATPPPADLDLSLIHGQGQVKRALEIAAAGGHNVLMQGPPGTGKTILARALSGILPAMSYEEMIEVTKIYSVAGALKREKPVIASRPFRNPHHTASAVAITGGGSSLRPGEVSLAHRGVLFLDELPEFQNHVLEAMRQPLEERNITVARASGSVSFPADFMLVAAMNPCPCGNLSNPNVQCVCPPSSIAKYRRRISGPLLDRIDIHIEVGAVAVGQLDESHHEHPQSGEIRERTTQARLIQKKRFQGEGIYTNSAMGLKQIKEHCRLGAPTREILHRAYDQYHMSVRSYYRLIKLGRTIADLAGEEGIEQNHILEALQYRPKVEM